MTKYELTAMERELAELIIDALRLEEIEPEEIDPGAALFFDGMGLDSIDALELGLYISKKYQLHINSEDEETKKIFASLRTLSMYVQNNMHQ